MKFFSLNVIDNCQVSYIIMIITYICLLSIARTTMAASSEYSLKGDPCSKFDSCFSKSLLRTCSCDSNCQVYGTCCHDMQKKSPGDAFSCYHKRVVVPVFVKRSCSGEFRGHVGDKRACLDDDDDEMDVKNNVLVTSHTSKITYWNNMCAICNNETPKDLQPWNIEVYCPPHNDVDRNFIRKNLTFDQDKRQWGLNIDDVFLHCIVKYAPPPYINEVKHCTPNLISSCPADFADKDIIAKCSKYYAERKLKNSETYYKNIHCAICNGADIKELECPGTLRPEDVPEETDFREMVEETFVKGEWLYKEAGNLHECSKGFSYDPFRLKCRKHDEAESITVEQDASGSFKTGPIALLVAFNFFVRNLL